MRALVCGCLATDFASLILDGILPEISRKRTYCFPPNGSRFRLPERTAASEVLTSAVKCLIVRRKAAAVLHQISGNLVNNVGKGVG